MVPTKTNFFFKKRKEKNEAGLVTKEIPAPPSMELEVPLLTQDDLVAILNSGDEKQIKLLIEAANDVILSQAREAVNADIEGVREKGLDPSVVDWAKIANLPPASRRGSAIPDEVWEAFTKDYTEVMQHHGKTKEKAETGAKILARKFQPVKGNKKVIQALKENLQTWFTNTAPENAAEFQAVYETLAAKADTLLEADEDALLAAV